MKNKKSSSSSKKSIDKSKNVCYNDYRKLRKEVNKMYVRIPTNLLMKMPTVKHLFGKWFWDTETKKLAKGDKTLRKKQKEILKKTLDK